MVVMAPAVESNSVTSIEASIVTCRGIISYSSEVSQGRSRKGQVDLCLSSHDLDNSCKVRPWSADVMTSQTSTIPQASPAFRETMGKMKSERKQSIFNGSVDKEACVLITPSSLPPSSSPSSLLHKLKSAFRSTSSSSTQNSSNNSRSSPPATSSSTSKTGNSRRPASFGGTDVIKTWTGRRASQHEKRVSWADEYGSNKALFSVKLIKSRLSMDKKPNRKSTPGQSILRSTGLH